jgi:hypothetical protein
MEILSTLHPAVACVVVISIAVVAGIFIYNFFKFLRGM